MKTDIINVIRTARQLSNDWYEQRTTILKFIEKILEKNPDKVQEKWFGENIHVIFFGYDDDLYFWWDGVKDDKLIDCSGLEIAIGYPRDGKLSTQLLWCSDSDEDESFIPKLPIYFE